MSQIKEKIGKFSFVDTAAGQYALHMDWSSSMSQLFDLGGRNWDDDPVSVAGERLGPGILDRKTGLLYGQGPALYRTVIEGNERVQQWVEDEEIQQWLESWDYRGFVRAALVEYTHLNGVFVKYRMGRGVRIGRPWVTSLECLHSADCRLVWPENDSRRLDDVTHVLVGDFDTFRSRMFEKFPVFDKWNPTRSEAAVRYHSMRSFGRNMYALSCFFGSVPWLENANDLPRIIHHLNENMIAAAYVVHAPRLYWKDIEEQIEEMHPDWTLEEVNKEKNKLMDRLTQQIADVMAGKNNAGKFFSCVDFTDDYGHAQSWKIEPIEMNIDKYIEAQAKISRIADSSTTSGFGLSPALANIIIDGKSDSGSQMLYALKIFYGADTQIAEDIALEAVNDAIRINFPEKKGIFLGLYRKVINKEDNVTAADRPTNQV